MKRMISGFWAKRSVAVVFLLTLVATGLLAIDIRLTPPQLSGDSPYLSEIQSELNRIFTDVEADLKSEFQGISTDPQKLIGAFATSSVFSSAGASLRTYQGYDTFALTVGAMGGVQLPGSPLSWAFGFGDELDKFLDDFERVGDIQAGVNPQILNAQLGLNTSRFLLKGLYLGLKGGYMNLNLNLEGFSTSFRTWSFGPMVNYQFIPQYRLAGGLIVWRGLNVGTGFIYQRTSFNMDLPVTVESGELFSLPHGGTVTIENLALRMAFSVNTYTVPLEAVTSVRLLGFLNFSLGAGGDFGFGQASLRANGNSNINIYGYESYGVTVETPGSLRASMGGENSPTLFNPKLMGSFGFSAGSAIILDIPVTYYFLNNGYNVGVSLGFAR